MPNHGMHLGIGISLAGRGGRNPIQTFDLSSALPSRATLTRAGTGTG